MSEDDMIDTIKTIEKIFKDSYSENDAGEYILLDYQVKEIINSLWDILG